MPKTFISEDGSPRCSWCAATSDYMAYHDNEWGYPVGDDIRLFEKICLESFQSGLSWRTILAKRDNFRQAFHGFDFNKISRYTEKDVCRLLSNDRIVRHRGKIEAVINNAKYAKILIKEHGSLAAYFWRFEPRVVDVSPNQDKTTSIESIALAKALKSQGWKFVGPTTIYAFMQAMGLVNDHADSCFVRCQVEAARKKFNKPKPIKR